MSDRLPPARPPDSTHPAPPDPPELPVGIERGPRWPRWPWWYSIAGFAGAFGATIVVSVIVGAIVGIAGAGPEALEGPVFNAVATGIQSAAFIGVAIGFAWMTTRPRPWHFGLRGTALAPAVGWSALAAVAFVLFSALYGALVRPEPQSTLEQLGVDEGTLALVLGAVLVIVLAPIAEEFFFRGFLYRALRSSLPIWAAAPIGGLVFGSVHVLTGIQAVPVLVVLGVLFCLVYERTGSLYPVIALHALNNMLAYMSGTGAYVLCAALGAALVAGCVLLPRFSGRATPAPA